MAEWIHFLDGGEVEYEEITLEYIEEKKELLANTLEEINELEFKITNEELETFSASTT